jgi:hypothetical protein
VENEDWVKVFLDCQLTIGGNVLHVDISSFLALSNKVVSNFDMLAPLMVNRILDKGNDGLIFAHYGIRGLGDVGCSGLERQHFGKRQ